VNEVDIAPEEMPTKEDTTFMLAPALAADGATQIGGVDDALVIFCIDVSGSMCVSTPVSIHGHTTCHPNNSCPSVSLTN